MDLAKRQSHFWSLIILSSSSPLSPNPHSTAMNSSPLSPLPPLSQGHRTKGFLRAFSLSKAMLCPLIYIISVAGIVPITDEEKEAQRDCITCPESHS